MSVDGIISLDKPAGISSAGAVGRVKRLLPRGTKIGHAGTLDPFATGVLVLLIGRCTKLCERLMDSPKQYEATIRFGATTATDDLDSPETPWADPAPPPDRGGVAAALEHFVGEISQRPPAYSALKVGGQRAYDLARGGQDVQLASRVVKVYGAELLAYEWPIAKVRVDCGRGVYIRALARDLGSALGVGGYLTALCRTRVGPFHLAQAVSLQALQADGVEPHLRQLDSRQLDSRSAGGDTGGTFGTAKEDV